MGHKSDQRANKNLTPAQKSARDADRVREEEEVRRNAEQKKRERAGKAERRVIEAEAKKEAPAIYREYRRLIAEAEKYGRREITTDRENWSGSYYGKEPEVSPEEPRKARIKEEARRIARKMLEKDGYKVVSGNDSGDTSWGVGSDALPTAGWSSSWIDISW